MKYWAVQVIDECLPARAPECARPRVLAMLIRIEVKAVDSLVTFKKKTTARREYERQALYYAEHNGFLMPVRSRGRLGTEYRLRTPEQRDAQMAQCDYCGAFVERSEVALPDFLREYLRRSREWQQGMLVLCEDCRLRDPHYVPELCPGCGSDDVICLINHRAVCPECYLEALGPRARRALVAGDRGTVDLEFLVAEYEQRVGPVAVGDADAA